MSKIHVNIVVVLVFVFSSFNVAYTQEEVKNGPSFEVHKIYPYISISKEKLREAKTIDDFKNETNNLNLDYKPEWVREYISVTLQAEHNGNIIRSVGQNEMLSHEQKEIMLNADPGTSLKVKVNYIPENSLVNNDSKELDFTIILMPDSDASFPGENEKLRKYLKEKAIDRISGSEYQNYDLSMVKFTINELGEVVNPHIYGSDNKSSSHEKIDLMLMETIRKMPCWNPATYDDGTTISQDFVLTVGNMDNCISHTLNIRRD